MRNGLKLVLVYVGAVAAGLAATLAFLRLPLMGSDIQVGAWRTSLVSGSVDADLYTRAKVARVGLLALSRAETLYFVADRDDTGAPLRSRCRYRIEGVPPPARWWSITAYADDFFLFADPQHRYSLAGAQARLDGSGQFVLHTGLARPEDDGAWLPTPGDRGLVLTLRLYQPVAELAAMPQRLEPPAIRAVGSCS
ncbi:MAG: DUF1214 domain-containing protein [Aquabacterium sp.]